MLELVLLKRSREDKIRREGGNANFNYHSSMSTRFLKRNNHVASFVRRRSSSKMCQISKGDYVVIVAKWLTWDVKSSSHQICFAITVHQLQCTTRTFVEQLIIIKEITLASLFSTLCQLSCASDKTPVSSLVCTMIIFPESWTRINFTINAVSVKGISDNISKDRKILGYCFNQRNLRERRITY